MLILTMAVFLAAVPMASSITCYECSSGQGRDCTYTSKACGYGFFGCVKIGVYSGGIDRMGNRYREESHIVSMLRGCSVLPLGNVDMCEQSVILGYRIVKCTCFNDFCNSSNHFSMFSIYLVIKAFIYLTAW